MVLGGAVGPSELEAVAAEFAHGEREVSYRQFVDAVLQAEVSTAPEPPQLEPEAEAHVQELLPVLRKAMQVGGFDVKASYEKFDPLRSGRVTRAQFIRAFPGPDTVTPRERELLAAKFARGDAVDYQAFAAEVMAAPVSALATSGWMRPVPPSPRAPDAAAALPQLLHRLRAGFFRARVRPLDFFADYDKHNTGSL